MARTFEGIRHRLEIVQRELQLTDKETEYLATPHRIGATELTVEGKKYPAWRILHSQALGPGKGGIRFHPGVDEDEVRSLAFWMALKTSLLGLPYGGAKGGIRVDPKGKTPQFLEKLSRAYIQAFYQDLGERKDIPAPDVYTTPQIMAWMLDEYERQVGHHEPAMITGKPLELNGCELRGDATARGGYLIIQQLMKHLGWQAGQVTVAIQGFGNAGAHVAMLLYADGMKVVAVSDSKGGTYDPEGLDLHKVAASKAEQGTVQSYPKGKAISNENLLELDVDILILAALENQVTAKNAGKVRARAVVELANGPVDREGDALLFQKKIPVVPDILANAGGVVVSYFEWVQNMTGNIFERAYLERKLEEKMITAWEAVQNRYEERNRTFDLRTAAYLLAAERIIKAERARSRV